MIWKEALDFPAESKVLYAVIVITGNSGRSSPQNTMERRSLYKQCKQSFILVNELFVAIATCFSLASGYLVSVWTGSIFTRDQHGTPQNLLPPIVSWSCGDQLHLDEASVVHFIEVSC
jgi:hypothetical protein